MRIETLPLWERLLASNLLEPAQLTIVRAEVNRWKESQLRGEAAGASEEAWLGLAEQRLQAWLVDHDLLTDYQAQVLRGKNTKRGTRESGGKGAGDARSESGRPLDLGAWRLVDQVVDWGLPHHYWVATKPRYVTGSEPGQSVGLSEVSPSGMLAYGQGLAAADWAAVRARVARLAGARDQFGPQVIVPWGTVTETPYCALLLPPCLAVDADERAQGERAQEAGAQDAGARGETAAGESGGRTDRRMPVVDRGVGRTEEGPADRGWGGSWPFQSLSQRMSPAAKARFGTPSTKRVLQWALDLAGALQRMHAAALPLGAINPAAVLVTSDKRVAWWAVPVAYLRVPGLAKACWGAARAESSRIEPRASGSDKEAVAVLAADFRSSQPQGWSALDFLPPERLVGAGPKLALSSVAATGADDVYSLGVLVYWMLTGQVPAAGQGVSERVAAKQVAGDWSWPESIPKQVRQCLLPLLAATPTARPSDMAEVIRVLQGVLKRDALPARALFRVPPAARQWEQASRAWSGAEWTTAAAAIEVEALPTLNKAIEVPQIVIDTGRGVGGAMLAAGEAEQSQAAKRAAAAESRGSSGQVSVVEAGGKASVRKLRQARGKPLRLTSPPVLSCLVSAAAVVAVLVGWWLAGAGRSTQSEPAESGLLAERTASDLAATQAESSGPLALAGWTQEVVADDGRLLWESPTVGLPLEVAYLPTNPTALLVLDRAFWGSPGLEPVLAALEGPVPSGVGADVRRWRDEFAVDKFSRAWIGVYQTLAGVDQAVVLEVDQDQPPVSLSLTGWKLIARMEPLRGVATPGEPASGAGGTIRLESAASPSTAGEVAAAVAAERGAGGDAARGGEAGGQQFLIARASGGGVMAGWLQLDSLPADWPAELPVASAERVVVAMFDPAEAEFGLGATPVAARRWVLGSPELVRDVISNGGETQVSGPMANLLTYSDRQRQLQFFVNPVTLWNAQGREWLGGRWQWVGQLIKDHVPAAVRMLGVSLHGLPGGEAYVEVKLAVDRAQSAASVMAPLVTDIQGLPTAAKRGLLDLPRIAYWETILLRYDDMLRDMSGQVRVGQQDRLPTLNVWLRPRALDNLLAATELYFMASGLGQGELPWMVAGQSLGPALVPDPRAAGMPGSLAELLRLPRSLAIPEQDLINALSDLETEIKTEYPQLGFEFSLVVDGNALRVEGITQNQKISDFQQQQQSLADILTAMVLKANPDPSVTSARDPACKLIWLVEPGEPEGRIRITTRAAAAERGWALPPQVAAE